MSRIISVLLFFLIKSLDIYFILLYTISIEGNKLPDALQEIQNGLHHLPYRQRQNRAKDR